ADNTATVIVDGQVAAIDFGSAVQGNNVVQTFAIENTGSSSLDISNINVSGTDFMVNNTLTSIAVGVTSTFTVTLSGSTAGNFNATVTIANNDADEGSFDFPITGMITSSACTTLPTVNAGSDLSPCAGTAVSLSGTFGGSATSASWTSSGTGTFDDNTLLAATYTPSAADVIAGSVILTLTVPVSGPCPTVADQVVITIGSAPVAGSPTIQSNINQATQVDVIGASTVNAGDVITVTILQAPTKGVVINSNNTVNYTATTGTIGADSFQYEICNQCGLCSTGLVSIDIVNATPVFTAPTTPPKVVIGQNISISIPSIVSDLNNNLDLNTFGNFSSSSNAPYTYNATTGMLTIDYTNVVFNSPSDNISFSICDQLNSCSNISLSITIDGDIIAFNGISPNGDGMNDFFQIQNIQFLEPVNKVSIFNRWGDKVFEMDNYNSESAERRFEGRQNNGKELPSGVYFYKVEFNSGRSSLNGYLTLKK
ncbi:MAG: gliding motility-associated C-terminal domain-containing protein, partial [Cyclobacteriaceae bacterium]